MACVLGNQWLIQSTGSGSNSIGQIKPAVNAMGKELTITTGGAHSLPGSSKPSSIPSATEFDERTGGILMQNTQNKRLIRNTFLLINQRACRRFRGNAPLHFPASGCMF